MPSPPLVRARLALAQTMGLGVASDINAPLAGGGFPPPPSAEEIDRLSGLADADPHMPAQFVLGMTTADNELARHMLGIVTGTFLQSEGPVAAAAWADSLPQGEIRSSAMSRIARDYVSNDPAAAAAWAAGYSGQPEGNRVIDQVGSHWAYRDPNAAVEAEYLTFIVETDDGLVRTGLVRDETDEGFVLVEGDGARSSVSRRSVVEMWSDGLSLMPEELEIGLDAQAMADLLAFLQQG